MSATPEEYFGPHAKRWTSPTGQVLSLKPADYDRMVNTQMELDFNARMLEEMEAELAPAPSETPHPDGLTAAGAWQAGEGQVPDPNFGRPLQPSEGLPTSAPRGGIKYPAIINMDTAYDAVDSEGAGLFKDRGVLTMPGNVESPPASTRPQKPPHLSADGWQSRPILADGDAIQVIRSGRIAHFTLTADGSIASIHPVPTREAGEPAARHLKPRRWSRIAAALGLVVIIIVIGVAAVVGVML